MVCLSASRFLYSILHIVEKAIFLKCTSNHLDLFLKILHWLLLSTNSLGQWDSSSCHPRLSLWTPQLFYVCTHLGLRAGCPVIPTRYKFLDDKSYILFAWVYSGPRTVPRKKSLSINSCWLPVVEIYYLTVLWKQSHSLCSNLLWKLFKFKVSL